jgi:hypothetical protein
MRNLKASEKQIQAAIVAYLNMRGILHAVTDASRAFGVDGRPRKSKVDPDWPDISAQLPVIFPVTSDVRAAVTPSKYFK